MPRYRTNDGIIECVVEEYSINALLDYGRLKNLPDSPEMRVFSATFANIACWKVNIFY